ncbi:universal stress protein [Pacificibacter marinus]|uniref:Universal stress protein family protein n=1 Tax=Pacificibacter marinus TaxID=658057 RepID=A0A1Y5SVZ8_9RHOB|nr:universal stress protein [Pacificibacter marinus]SEK85298.1 Nucleotide-binding universal stress protein, UspA family [Pacificibacter marinus]SLN49629.1 Universal stress protein family protein [Pacificibacter marinus]
MTIYSKVRISNPLPYFETPTQVLGDDNLSHDDKEKVLRSMALDADQLAEATVEGMQGGSRASNADDLQSALIQLEDIKEHDGVDKLNQSNSRFKKIMVVTTVDQDMNRTIADIACNMAAGAGGSVYLLSVVPSDFEVAGLAASGPMSIATPLVLTDDTQMLEDRTQQLEALRGEIESNIEIEIEVRSGQIEQVIVNYADDCDADVMVVGSPNRSWLETLLDTSVSRKVTKSAQCPVLVVPAAT